ncbi:MAG: mannose-1-phosphate guanylyltransferase [Thermoplasmatota archaeon]
MKAVILAGGSGKRFWPLSTGRKPKQFLNLDGRGSLIRETFDRLMMRFMPRDILVITSRDNVDMTMSELPEIPRDNIVGEPAARNTAAACAVGAVVAGTDEIQLVVPADHCISDPDRFWEHFDIGKAWLERNDSLVAFGILPNRPETGYGYMEAGVDIGSGLTDVIKFCEKPDRKKAEEYVGSGSHYWNSGMFMWKGSTLLREIEKWEPGIYREIVGMNVRDRKDMESRYGKIPAISIDYAVMERSDKVLMIPSDFPWTDLGSWMAIREMNGYSEDGKNILLDESERTYVHGDPKKPVAVIGMKDVVIVDTPEGLLVCREDLVQKVRSAYERFEDLE